MISWYKGYKIITNQEKRFSQYEIYFSGRCEGTGYLMDDFGGEDLAAEYARSMIAASFETPVLSEIRKLPKY